MKNEQESLESENLELKSEVDSYKEKVKEAEEELASAVKNLESFRQASQKSTEIEKGTYIFCLYLCFKDFIFYIALYLAKAYKKSPFQTVSFLFKNIILGSYLLPLFFVCYTVSLKNYLENLFSTYSDKIKV